MQKLAFAAGAFLTALFFSPAFCPAQTISIVSGNGQLVCPDCISGGTTFSPLLVQVNSTAGLPMANATVTWVLTQTGVQTATSTSTTNSSGQASYNLVTLAPFGTAFDLATVVASIPSASVQFVETTTGPGAGGVPELTPDLVTGGPPALSGAVDQTSATTIEVSVASPATGPVPNIGVTLVPTAGPTVSCAPVAGQETGQQPGLVLTNSLGIATCTPVFGGIIGTGSYTVVIAGKLSYGPGTLTVTAGVPAIVKIYSGSNQSVNSGSRTPLALQAEVTDLAGNPSNAATVTWSVTSGTATLSSVISTTSPSGLVSAYVTPTVGPVQVTVSLNSNPSLKAVFSVNVNLVVTTLQYVSGTNQSAKQEIAFTDPLIVQVNDNSTPLPGVTVTWAVTSGPATLSATSAVTNAQGQAQITATAGSAPGAVVITASVAYAGQTFSVPFSLTVLAPGPIITSVENSAGFQSQFVSPCGLATAYGTGLTNTLQGVVVAPIAPQNQVAGLTVQFGTPPISAPILYAANVNGVESVSFQVPCNVPSSSATPPASVPMVVSAGGVASPPFDVTVLPIAPGIFQFQDTDGQNRAVLVRPDGSFASASNPVAPGEIVRMFVTGLGQTSPPLSTDEFDPIIEVNGAWVPQSLPVVANVVVGVNNGGVLVLSAQYAYGMVGVYEVDFQVPENTATGNSQPFAIAVYQGSNLLFGNPSLIAIQ